MKTSIWWIRRDFRLTDNQALTGAMNSAQQVIPLFIFDPKLLDSPHAATRRVAFMYEGLRALDADLQNRGSSLIVRHGNPVDVLKELQQETGFEYIFAEEDYSPYARCRDAAVKDKFDLSLCPGLTMLHPTAVVKADGSPYTVFTPYSHAWMEHCQPGQVLAAPGFILSPQNLKSEPIPDAPDGAEPWLFPAGESEAQQRLQRFLNGAIDRYADERDRLDKEGTSSLSPYLHFGQLSIRQVVAACNGSITAAQIRGKPERGESVWLNELIWREFYLSILYHFPFVHEESFKPEMRNLRWLNCEEDFAAWREGRTGYPIVDAAMHQLNQTGWMHNRARMIVASFLTKDLLIDWRWGERFFLQQLLDGDVAANNGGWQWCAGTGTDAAPYFRVFNPVLQGQKFDPQGEYIRRWLPQLREVPEAYVHTPWKFKEELSRMGVFYPDPIVDHAQARQRCLRFYKGEKLNG